MTYYAHTGLSKYNVPPQSYEDHIRGMLNIANMSISILSPFYQKAVSLAILFHDLGKLFPESQKVLSQLDRAGERIVNHVDAGVAYCLLQHSKTNKPVWLMAARLIHAHHIGLENKETLIKESHSLFDLIQTPLPRFRDTSIQQFTDSQLEYLYACHREILSAEENRILSMSDGESSEESSMRIRFAMSILVDADHTDTEAPNYSYNIVHPYTPKWNFWWPERLTFRLTGTTDHVLTVPKGTVVQQFEVR